MTTTVSPEIAARPGRVRSVWSVLRSDKRLLAAAVMMTILVLVALFGPLIAPYDYDEVFVAVPLTGPSREHLMGSDVFGRDVFTRVIYGARVSLLVALMVAAGALVIGFPLGLLIGFKGGRVDRVVSRVLDMMFAFPSILLALVVATLLGPGLWSVTLALVIAYIPTVTRVTRSATLVESGREYVMAARVTGTSAFHIAAKHIVPNVTSPLLVVVSLLMSVTVLAEAALSYLGLGVQPPTPSWGNMLTEDSPYIFVAPYVSIFPGLAIAFFVLALNLLGDGLRDQLDPRLRSVV